MGEEVPMESQQVLGGPPAAAAAVASEQTQKFSLFALTAMVVGSMVGAIIFSLRRTFGEMVWGRRRGDGTIVAGE